MKYVLLGKQDGRSQKEGLSRSSIHLFVITYSSFDNGPEPDKIYHREGQKHSPESINNSHRLFPKQRDQEAAGIDEKVLRILECRKARGPRGPSGPRLPAESPPHKMWGSGEGLRN